MDIKQYVIDKASLARAAARKMSIIDTNTKNRALNAMAEALIKNQDIIISANSKDMENGKKNGTSEAMLDRLLLNEKRIKEISNSLKDVALLKDPIGKVDRMWKIENGLQIGQIKVPLGVIGMIYESRPNVTVDAAALCIKSGNCVILRGGSDAINSNIALSNIITEAAISSGLPKGCIQLLEVTDREAVNVMMKLNRYIDVLIPRGGASLINNVVKNASVPVIQTGVGNCHIFVDESADFKIAKDIIINAKVQRPGVCNALETLLIHESISEKFLPELKKVLDDNKVKIKGCIKTKNILPNIELASEDDWKNEYLDLILAVKIVSSIDESIDHIYKYGTKHSEAIITNDYNNSQKFLNEVDAAAVYVNASTRFTDGSQFGFGAEIGISTQKLHARGPMALENLTTIKSIIYGQGQIRK